MHSNWEYFSEEELGCRCGMCNISSKAMDDELMEWVVTMRKKLDFPFPVTSGARCPPHDLRVGGRSNHTINFDSLKCHALDIQVSNERMYKIIDYVYGNKGVIRGLGIKARGPHAQRFIHIDNNPKRDDQLIIVWSYN